MFHAGFDTMSEDHIHENQKRTESQVKVPKNSFYLTFELLCQKRKEKKRKKAMDASCD